MCSRSQRWGEVASVSFAVEFWGWVVLYYIRSSSRARNFFILYVHEHDRLCFGMLTVGNSYNCRAVFDCSLFTTEKVSRIRSNIIWNRWKSNLRTRSIWVILNRGTEKLILCPLLIRPGEILESVARSLFTMNQHAMANVYLYLCFLLRIMVLKIYTLTN